MDPNSSNPYQSPVYVEEDRGASVIPELPAEKDRNRLGEAGACLAGYGLILAFMAMIETDLVFFALGTVPGLIMSLFALARTPRKFAWLGVVLGSIGPAVFVLR